MQAWRLLAAELVRYQPKDIVASGSAGIGAQIVTLRERPIGCSRVQEDERCKERAFGDSTPGSFHCTGPPASEYQKHGGTTELSASPTLVFTAVTLVLFLTILEIDLHRDELRELGFIFSDKDIEPIF
jgi:hypothetical protein